jgi:hypothetical protein
MGMQDTCILQDRTRQTDLFCPIFASVGGGRVQRSVLRKVPSVVRGQASRGVQRQPLHSLCIAGEGFTRAKSSIGSMCTPAEASRVLRRDQIRRMMAHAPNLKSEMVSRSILRTSRQKDALLHHAPSTDNDDLGAHQRRLAARPAESEPCGHRQPSA